MRSTETSPRQPAADDAAAARHPGADADAPQRIPARGWKQLLLRSWKEAKSDQVPLLSAGVAFYAFLSIFPAAIAGTLLFGLVADPADIVEQIEGIGADVLPDDARSLLTEQLTSLASANERSLGIGLVIALATALWSASAGTGNLITAINVAYDEKVERNFVKSKALALAMAAGAVLFVLVAVGLILVIPAVIGALDLGTAGVVATQVGRYGLLVVAIVLALAVLYRYAPDRANPRWAWVTPGAVVALVLWLLASVAFSIYANNFGSYSKTYGALAGVIILLFWLWMSAYAILLGAEVNSEAELQTNKDTTTGPELPMGEREAVKADTRLEDSRDPKDEPGTA